MLLNKNKIEVIRTYFDGSASNQHISSSSRDCFGAYVIGFLKYSYFKSENANTSNQAEYDALIKLLEEIHRIKDSGSRSRQNKKRRADSP